MRNLRAGLLCFPCFFILLGVGCGGFDASGSGGLWTGSALVSRLPYSPCSVVRIAGDPNRSEDVARTLSSHSRCVNTSVDIFSWVSYDALVGKLV